MIIQEDFEHLQPFVTARAFLPALLLCSWLISPAPGADSTIGSVKAAHGNAVVRRGTETLPCQEGFHLIAQDVLQTSKDGSVGVILQDGTRIALGPNSELKIDQFVYQPVDGKFALLIRLARGVMAYVSGKIAQFAPEAVKVETPVGFVGLRGTHFAISLDGG